MTWEARDELRREANKKKVPVPTLEELANKSQHRLEVATTGWRCLACTQTAVRRRKNMAKWWLQSPCAAVSSSGSTFSLKGRCAHFSHDMRWSRKEKGHFCYNCGGIAKQYVSEKLADECKPAKEKSNLYYVVRALRKHA